MSGSFLLDTNIVIRLLNGDPDVRDAVARADESILCAVVLGELFYGAYKSQSAKENLLRIQELAESGDVLVCDERTANEYGSVKNDLRAKGRPIPENDVWIAALARQYNLVIATRDQHFAEVDGLSLDPW